MESRQRIAELIYEAIDEINRNSGPNGQIEKSPETVIIGPAGKLDSLRFVEFAVSVEQRVDKAFHRTITVFDAVLSDERDHWTVSALAHKIAELIEPRAGAPAGG